MPDPDPLTVALAQRDALGNALGRVLTAAGAIPTEAVTSGPDLLVAAERLTNDLLAARQQQAAAHADPLSDVFNRDDGHRSTRGYCYAVEDGADGYAVHHPDCPSVGRGWSGPNSDCIQPPNQEPRP